MRKDPKFQTKVIVVGNLLFTGVVLAVWFTEYPKYPQAPWLFFALEAFVILSGAVLLGVANVVFGLLEQMGGAERASVPPLSRMNARVQAYIVFGLSGIVVVAVASLVWFTGLGVESPFVPMAAAPAVFGPFVAGNQTTVGALVLIVVTILGLITALAPRSACGLKRCAHAQQHHPRALAFFLVTAVFLLIAGYISARRLATEHELAEERVRLANLNDEVLKDRVRLAKRNRELAEENRKLRARLDDP